MSLSKTVISKKINEFLKQNQLQDVTAQKKETGETLLHLIAKQGRTDLLIESLDILKNIDPKDNVGQTPLFYAIKELQIETLCELLRLGANINHKNNDQITPLYFANNIAANLATGIAREMLENNNTSFIFQEKMKLKVIHIMIGILVENDAHFGFSQETMLFLSSTLNNLRLENDQLSKTRELYKPFQAQIKAIQNLYSSQVDESYVQWEKVLPKCKEIAKQYCTRTLEKVPAFGKALNQCVTEDAPSLNGKSVYPYDAISHSMVDDFLKQLDLLTLIIKKPELQFLLKLIGPFYAMTLLIQLEVQNKERLFRYQSYYIKNEGLDKIKNFLIKQSNESALRFKKYFFDKTKVLIKPLLKNANFTTLFYDYFTTVKEDIRYFNLSPESIKKWREHFLNEFTHFVSEKQKKLIELSQNLTEAEKQFIIDLYNNKSSSIIKSSQSILALDGTRKLAQDNETALQSIRACEVAIAYIACQDALVNLSNYADQCAIIIQFFSSLSNKTRQNSNHPKNLENDFEDSFAQTKKQELKAQYMLEQQRRAKNAVLREEKEKLEKQLLLNKALEEKQTFEKNHIKNQLLMSIRNLSSNACKTLCSILKKGKHIHINQTNLLELFDGQPCPLPPFTIKNTSNGYQIIFQNTCVTTFHKQHGKPIHEQVFNEIRNKILSLGITLDEIQNYQLKSKDRP